MLAVSLVAATLAGSAALSTVVAPLVIGVPVTMTGASVTSAAYA
jgi:hypothetical protein